MPFDCGGEGGGLVELRLPLAIVCNWLELGKQTRGVPQEVRCKDAHRGPNCHNGQTKDLVNDHRKDPPRPYKRNFESLNADLL